jgi:hypothetical protein
VRRLRAELDRIRTRQDRQHRHQSSPTVDDTAEVSKLTASQIADWGQVLTQQGRVGGSPSSLLNRLD